MPDRAEIAIIPGLHSCRRSVAAAIGENICSPAAPALFSLAGGSMPRSLHLALAISCSLLPFSATAQQPSFTVGTAAAKPGQKATGTIHVPAASDPTPPIPLVSIPVPTPAPPPSLLHPP